MRYTKKIGELKKINIVTNNVGCILYIFPDSDDEVEQHLTINNEGRVWFSSYIFGEKGKYGKYTKAESKNFSIDKTSAKKLLDLFSQYFSEETFERYINDGGTCDVSLTTTDGKIYVYCGSPRNELETAGIELSGITRKTLNMDNLFVFDDKAKEVKINKVAIDYHRVSKVKTREDIEYSENLTIDRKTGTLEQVQNIRKGCTASHKYTLKKEVEAFLDEFYPKDFFKYIEGNHDDVIENTDETKDYKITIDYENKAQKIIEGTFDKNGLPEDFSYFASGICEFFKTYGIGEILSPSVYDKEKRCKSAYIFCSVSLGENYKTYYYLTEDDSIEEDDYVIVPVGKSNNEIIGKVEKIEYFSKDKVPLPIEKTKSIIRKADNDEISSLGEEE